MSQLSQLTTFYLTCPEPRAWLVINGENQESRVLEMSQQYPDHWSASAWLTPGQYHCRHYSGDDHNVTYYGPAHRIDSVDEGMDGLVSVNI